MTPVTPFTETCDKSYDRHNYRVYFKDGNSRVFDNWEDAQAFWLQFTATKLLQSVEVIDKPQKRTKAKGF